MDPCSSSFFRRDTLDVASDLIGSRLVREDPEHGRILARIVETEAYTQDDPACHGSRLYDPETDTIQGNGRGADLFTAPGRAYVYLIYGMHWMLNVVTEPEGVGGAVLIRAVEPREGETAIRERRGDQHSDVDLTNGPGKVAEAFGVTDALHGTDLTQPPLYFSSGSLDGGETIATSSRIGISKAVDRQWRFYLKEHPYVSRATPSGQQAA